MSKKHSAFSLIELSIVILIIGILVAGVTQGSRLVGEMRLSSARAQTQSSPIISITNLVLWLETTNDSSIISSTNNLNPADGDKVSTWNDYNPQTISKTNLTQATDASRPIYNTGIVNGLPALKFDGTATYFSMSNIMSGNFSLFVVLQTAVAGTAGQAYLGKPILTSEVGGAANDVIPLAIGGGFAKIFSGSPDSTLTGAITVSDNKPHLIYTARNQTSGARNIYIDGTADGTDTGTIGTLNANAVTTIGGDVVNGVYFSGYIAEIVIFDRLLKTEERKAVEAYLGKKWKIKVS